MSDTVESKPSTLTQIGTYVGFVGLILTIIAFLGLYYSWSFSRGFLSGMNLPTSLIPFAKASEVFPNTGIQWIATDLLGIVFALLFDKLLALFHHEIKEQNKNNKKKESYFSQTPRTNKSGRFFKLADRLKTLLTIIARGLLLILLYIPVAFLSISFLISKFVLLNPSLIFIKLLLVLVAIMSFFIIALFALNSRGNTFKWILTVILVLSTIQLQSDILFLSGRNISDEIRDANNPLSSDMIPSIFNNYEIPFVAVTSNRPLSFHSVPTVTNGAYFYHPSSPSFLRLIYTDGNTYYFFEGTPNDSTTLAVNASSVIEIQYISSSH